MPDMFYNPYNFIPAIPPCTDAKNPLSQGRPNGHDRYHETLWNGRISIRITTTTPLLIPDASEATTAANNHQILPLRLGPDGRPLLPVTSLKGALRSAFEAVTNSRFGVFASHDAPPARRMSSREGLSTVPVRLVRDREGSYAAELWLGTHEYDERKGRNAHPFPTKERGNWIIPGGVLYAAWLPRYVARRSGVARNAVRYRGGEASGLPEHDDEVVCWVELFESRKRRFRYWRVRQIATRIRELAPEAPLPSDSRPGDDHQPVGGEPLRRVSGWVFVSNQNIGNKHDERVFFTSDTRNVPKISLTDTDFFRLEQNWSRLIRNYKELHKEEIRKRGRTPPDEYLGREPGQTAWSRHVYKDDAERLVPGTLCYARVEPGKPARITALYPVSISRELGNVSPAEMLPQTLHPAQDLDELSPADRVFGWVNQGGSGARAGNNGKSGDGAWRGQMRIFPIRCCTKSEEAITHFAQSLPLAILSSPKIAEGGFYLAADRFGEPLTSDPATSGYFAKNGASAGLRGRKVYPHHGFAGVRTGYWDGAKAEAEARERTGSFWESPHREFIRRKRSGAKGVVENRDDQNRSVSGWVNPDTVFETEIDVINLNAAELGALLWLLSLPENHHHRIGGAKPLGFGSVRIEITRLDLANGRAKQKEFSSLFPVDQSGEETASHQDLETGKAQGPSSQVATDPGAAAHFVQAYKAALRGAYPGKGGSAFENIPFIAAFLKAATGHDTRYPVHYPRENETPTAEGENFKWFEKNRKGERRPLGTLRNNPTLPYPPEDDPNGGRRR